MNDSDLKNSVLTSLFWKFLERGGVVGVQFVVQIVLARLLFPSDYGIIALIIVFISISQIFVQGGLGTALIQRKEVTDEDYSSIFFLSLGVAAISYIVLFIASPLIASFYDQELITPIIRVLGLTLFFGAVNSIQNAVIARTFQFKKLFLSSLCAVIASGSVGIAMAQMGYGVWALVGQQLVMIVSQCTVMWFTVKWRPILAFSFYRVKNLFSFGWKLLVSGLVDVVYLNLNSLIIGKIYPARMLGFYSKGQEFPQLLVNNIDSSIQSVMLPAYSINQDDRPRVKRIMRRALVTSSFVVFPAMMGLAVVADPLIRILLTEKWLIAVPFLQIFCARYALVPIHTVNLQAINALGRSDIYLKLQLLQKGIGLVILAITVPLGIYAMAMGLVVSGVIGSLINAYPNKILLDYRISEQWKDLMPALLLSLTMGVVTYAVLWLGLSMWLTLGLQVMVGIATYFGLAWMLKLDSLTYLIKNARAFFKKND